MTYTNDMRYAVRALDNPTPLHIDVAEKDGQIRLLVDREGFQRLGKRQQSDYKDYVNKVARIIEQGGGGRVEVITVG